jgi:hypothetical protein
MYQIKAIAPTHHTLNELRKFGMEIIPLGNGSHQSTKLFTNLIDAQRYLSERLLIHWQNSNMVLNDYENWLIEITQNNRLSFGNITAEIIEPEEEEGSF